MHLHCKRRARNGTVRGSCPASGSAQLLVATRADGSRPAGAVSADLVNVFEEDPLVEAAALVALADRFRYDIFPAHAMSRGQRLQNFQYVRQFRPQLPVRRRRASSASSISFARSAARYLVWSSTRVTGRPPPAAMMRGIPSRTSYRMTGPGTGRSAQPERQAGARMRSPAVQSAARRGSRAVSATDSLIRTSRRGRDWAGAGGHGRTPAMARMSKLSASYPQGSGKVVHAVWSQCHSA
jgi:hypothetical protein